MKLNTVEEVCSYLRDSDSYDPNQGLFYIDLDQDGEITSPYNPDAVRVESSFDGSEWAGDLNDLRFCREAMTLDNPSFKAVCIDLLNQIERRRI